MRLKEVMDIVGYDAGMVAFHARQHRLNEQVVNRAINGLPVTEQAATIICDVMSRAFGLMRGTFTPKGLGLVVASHQEATTTTPRRYTPPAASQVQYITRHAAQDKQVERITVGVITRLAQGMRRCGCPTCQRNLSTLIGQGQPATAKANALVEASQLLQRNWPGLMASYQAPTCHLKSYI